MRKALAFFIMLLCSFTLYAEPVVKQEPRAERLAPTVFGWYCTVVGYDACGNQWIGYSYGYPDRASAIARATSECNLLGGYYNQFIQAVGRR